MTYLAVSERYPNSLIYALSATFEGYLATWSLPSERHNSLRLLRLLRLMRLLRLLRLVKADRVGAKISPV